jgi:hypothetical protein
VVVSIRTFSLVLPKVSINYPYGLASNQSNDTQPVGILSPNFTICPMLNYCHACGGGMGILSWLGKKSDEAVIERCKGHLMTTLAASDRDAAYFTLASTAVWALFERVFEEQIHDPVEYLIKLQSRIEMQGPDHAAAFSNQLLKSISDPRTPATVVMGMSLIAAWI